MKTVVRLGKKEIGGKQNCYAVERIDDRKGYPHARVITLKAGQTFEESVPDTAKNRYAKYFVYDLKREAQKEADDLNEMTERALEREKEMVSNFSRFMNDW